MKFDTNFSKSMKHKNEVKVTRQMADRMYISDYLLTKLQLIHTCVVTEKHTLSSKLIKFNEFIEP